MVYRNGSDAGPFRLENNSLAARASRAFRSAEFDPAEVPLPSFSLLLFHLSLTRLLRSSIFIAHTDMNFTPLSKRRLCTTSECSSQRLPYRTAFAPTFTIILAHWTQGDTVT